MNPSNEPVGWGGVVTAIAVAAIPFLRAFGIYDMSEEQTSAFLGLLAALIFGGTFVVRSKVSPTDIANDRIRQATRLNPGATPPTL